MKSGCNRETVIRREEIFEPGIVYRYELILSEGNDTASFGIKLYEINTEMEIDGARTSYRSGGLFSNEEKGVSFFEKLVENRATPINIPYIIEDTFGF